MEKILIIDDDTELCRLLDDFLSTEGFVLDIAPDGKKGIDKALCNKYELIVLDIMLPEINGFDVLRKIRAHSDVPVLMLTARGEDIDKIIGLELGADDYLSKPFNTRELSARIRAILRRSSEGGIKKQMNQPSGELCVGDVKMDLGTRTVISAGMKVPLTAVEFRLLEILLREAGNVVSRERLSGLVLQRELTPYDRSLDVHVSSLRKKLWRKSKKDFPIQAIRGVGYIYTLTKKTGKK